MEGSMGSMANAIANKLFQPKATTSNPKTRFFPIDHQWQKPLTPQKNLIQKQRHKLALKSVT
jgi:hypothetical protein